MTTIDTMTQEQVQQLRDNAGEAGDLEQVALCDRVLAVDRWDDDSEASAACLEAIRCSEAQDS